jgi:hypothetical protein
MTIYEKNYDSLGRHHAELISLLSHPISTTHLRLSPSQRGPSRLHVQLQSGEEIELHDSHDPIGVMEDTALQLALNAEGVTVLLGLELGYLPIALAQCLPDQAALLIVEPDPGIFLTALQETDLTELLESPKVKILVGSPDRFGDSCALLMAKTGTGVRMVGSETAGRIIPTQFRATIQKDISRCHTTALASQNALGKRGAQFMSSVLENIPHILMSPGIQQLRDLVPTLPALLVAAGPSLEKNVYHLHAAKGRSVIICADTALRFLLVRGITPDFVVSADPQEETYRKYEGLDIPQSVSLVFHPATNPQIVKYFPGKKFVFDCSIPAYRWLQRFWSTKGTLEQETMCQVHIGFNLAEWLGCQKIILVGQDLSYSNEGMHAKGSSYLSTSEFDSVNSRSRWVKDIFGQSVRTEPTFLNYKSIFEKKIARFSGNVVNATEGGLLIEGAEMGRLVDVLSEWCPNDPIDIFTMLNSMVVEDNPLLWQDLIGEIRARSRDCFRIARTAKHVTRLLTRIRAKRQASTTVDSELIRLGQRTERLTSLIPQYSFLRQLLHWMDISLERHLREDTQVVGQAKEVEDRRDKETERGLRYYERLEQVALLFRDLVAQLEERIVRLQRVLRLEGDPDSFETPHDLFQACLELDLWHHATFSFEKILASHSGRPSTPEIIHQAIDLSVALHQIGLAKQRLEFITEDFLSDPRLSSLKIRVEEQWAEWQAQIQLASEQFPPTPESAITAGDFYHRVGDYSRAKHFYNQALEEEGLIPDEILQGYAHFFHDPQDSPASV